MRYLLLLCLALPVSAQQVAVMPCPSQQILIQWLIDNPAEVPAIQELLKTGDVATFVKSMEAIGPTYGEWANRYALECFAST